MNSSPLSVDSVQSFTPFTTGSSCSIINPNVHRYLRSSLIQLRSNGNSKKRPECALRTELMSLGIWKASSNTGSSQPNGNGNDGSIVAAGEKISINSSSAMNMPPRVHRSPSTRKHMSSVILAKCESPSSNYGSNFAHSNQKNYIDHRSASSAHLLPAFAKRRIGVLHVGSTSSVNSTSPVRPLTPSDSNQTAKNVQYISRQRADRKDHPNDRQRSSEHLSSSYSSPQRKNFGDGEIERVEIDLSSVASSSSTLCRTRNNSSHAGNDRRIGSGRLLHCDANWEYRSSERENVRNPISTDKEAFSHHYQQRSAAQFTDSTGDRSSYVERRSYDRRSNDIDHEKFNNRNNNIHSGPDPSPNRIARIRRNNCNERVDEPEWFSGGPISQHDTIELRGFDEMEENYCNKNKISHRKLSESSSSRTSSNLNLSNMKSKDSQYFKDPINKENDNSEVINISTESNVSASTPSIGSQIGLLNRGDDNNNDGQDELESKKSIANEKVDESVNKKTHGSISSSFTEFNFDNFLNMDPLNHSLMGVDMKSDEDLELIENSRFSRWFSHKDIPLDRCNQRESNDSSNESTFLDSTETAGIAVEDCLSPTPSESQKTQETNTLMQFIQRNKLPPSLNDCCPPHVIMPSVEELEARMHKIHSANFNSELTPVEGSQQNTSKKSPSEVKEVSTPNSPTSQDTDAFKKLLEQLGSANMLDVQDTQQFGDHQMLTNSSALLNSHASKNVEINKQAVQHELIQQQFQMPQGHQPFPIDSLQKLDQNMSGFAAHKSKFQQSLSRGELKVDALEHELNNSCTGPYAKEIIAAVLKDHSRHVLQNSIQNVPTGGCANQKLQSPITVNPGNQHSIQQQGCFLNHGHFMANSQLPNTTIFPSQLHSAAQQGTFKSGLVLGSSRDLQLYSQMIMHNVDVNNKSENGEQYWKRRLDIDMHERLLKAGLIPRSIQLKVNQKNHPESFDFVSQRQSSQPTQTSPQQQSSYPTQQQRHINSPTPLAFTPTSVLRKMTAEKDNSSLATISVQQQATSQVQATSNMPTQRQLPHHQIGTKNNQSVLVNQQQQKLIIQQQTHQQVFPSNATSQPQITLQQPRMILGGGNHQLPQVQICNGGLTSQQHSLQQQQNSTVMHQSQQVQKMRSNQQLKWPLTQNLNQQQQMPLSKPIGRPILKGPLPTGTQSQQKQQQISPMPFVSRIEFQQQKIKMNPTLQHPQPQFSITQQAPPNNILNHTVQQHIFQHQQHQQRSAALQRASHMNLQPLRQAAQQLSRQANIIGSNATQSVSNNVTTGNSSGVVNYQRDGGLSPTSNQLAQWFSPELLAQASAGKLPLLNMNQALSLEEFERSIQHSSTAVQN